MAERGKGFIPDPVDERDFRFSRIKNRLLKKKNIVELPKSVDLRPIMSPIRDQGRLSSCTAFAVAVGLMESIEIEHFKSPFTPLSPLFLYYATRASMRSTKQDNGATLRAAVKTAANIGVCTENSWSYSEDNVFTKPNKPAYTEANNKSNRIKTYYRVADLPELRQALAAKNPVVIGLMLYESFESKKVEKTGMVPMPSLYKESLVGGHAMCAVGYDDDTRLVLVRNSWSDKWGISGYCWVPYEYFLDPALSCDFWTAVN